MSAFFRRLIPFLVAGLLAAGTAGTAIADAQLDAFRAQGVIAESYTGYVVLRDQNAPPAAKALVQDVNAKRRAVYQKRASEQGVSADEVGKIYAKEIFQKAPSKTFFLQANGSYVQK